MTFDFIFLVPDVEMKNCKIFDEKPLGFAGNLSRRNNQSSLFQYSLDETNFTKLHPEKNMEFEGGSFSKSLTFVQNYPRILGF